MDYYEAIALKIVPTGSHPSSVVSLRKQIAAALAAEAKRVADQQRDEKFPELAVLRKELDQRATALSERESAIMVRDQRTTQQEKQVAALIDAFTRWLSWMEGDGDVSENATRFNAVRDAYRNYKGGKK